MALPAGLAVIGQGKAFSEDVCHVYDDNLDIAQAEHCRDLPCMDNGDRATGMTVDNATGLASYSQLPDFSG